MTSSLGKPVVLRCSLQGPGAEEEDPPDVVWMRDGQTLHYADTNQVQVPFSTDSWRVTSTLRLVCLSVCLSVCVSLCLSVCLPVSY